MGISLGGNTERGMSFSNGRITPAFVHSVSLFIDKK